MNKKLLLILIISVPILGIGFWIYLLINVSSKADINQAKISDSQVLHTGADSKKIDFSQNNASSKPSKTGDTQIITVYMPSYFDNNGFKILKQELGKQNIFVRYKTFDDLQSYQKALVESLKSGKSDIFLAPSIWIDTLGNYGEKLNFSGINLGIYTNYLFNDYVNNDKFTFIPFSIDPFASFVNKKNFLDKSTLSVSDIKEKSLISQKDSLSKLILPVVFGVSKFDIAFLQGGGETFNNYFLTLYGLTYLSVQNKDSTNLKSIIDFGTNDLLKIRDYKKFKNLLGAFDKTNSSCDTYQNICVLSNGFGNSSFGFLSDMDIMDKYFTKSKLSSNDFYYYNIIGNGQEYPVVARGFMLNKKSKNFKASAIFLKEYINSSIQGNGFFWNNQISAFNDIASKQRNQSKFDKIMSFSNNFKILTGTVNFQKSFLSKTKILDVLKGNYSIEGFIQNPGRKF